VNHPIPFRGALLCFVALLLALPAVSPAQDEEEDDGFTTDFFIEDCSFSDRGANRFWSLNPGDQSVLEGEEDGEELEVIINVTHDTEVISFVTDHGVPMTVRARVIEEVESEDGELVEVSRNWYARCRETNDVFYFGEEVDLYEDGEIVGSEGAWRAGENGAQPGVIMPGTFLLGSRYYQEFAPEDEALDQATHTEMDLDLDVPAGSFERCVQVIETTPVEPDDESEKLYCPGVGLVFDDGVELTEYNPAPPPGPPGAEWLTAPLLGDFEVQVRITAGDSVQPSQQEVAGCDPETVCVSGALPGRIEALVRVPGPRPNDCFWPTITKLTSSQVEVWVRRISTGEVNYYVVDGSSPGSSDLPGFFDRTGFCD
jgi:hypothetical protein